MSTRNGPNNIDFTNACPCYNQNVYFGNRQQQKPLDRTSCREYERRYQIKYIYKPLIKYLFDLKATIYILVWDAWD
jgi:hypothetical protein